MLGSRLELSWLICMAIGALVLGMTACGVVAPITPTATSAATSTPKPVAQPLELVILYTSDAKGLTEGTVTEG